MNEGLDKLNTPKNKKVTILDMIKNKNIREFPSKPRRRKPIAPPPPPVFLPRKIEAKDGAKLKILWLYQYSSRYNFDHWLHMDVAKKIKETEGIDLMGYGLNLDVGYPDIAPITYDKSITLKKLRECFPFDVIICNTKSRMFCGYLPDNYPFSDSEPYAIDCWLPIDFRDFDCPKIMIEEDYHYEHCDDWYVEEKFDLILQRHYSQSKRNFKIKCLWHPFSVDTSIFKPECSKLLENKICFTGSNTVAYTHRNKAIEILEKEFSGMFVNKNSIIHDSEYTNNLNAYISHLNGSSMFDITSAKMFEIVSSGSVLFTNENNKYGLLELFPPEAYVTYKEDCSDVIEKARYIINNPKEMGVISEMGVECIKTKHSHEIRIKELCDIIEKEFGI